MSETCRPTVIIGNWKMNKSIVEARAFIAGLALTGHRASTQVGLAVPFTMLEAAAEAARGSGIAIGAQNVCEAAEGAFTGEISCAMLKDAGASFVIVGHSERRRLYHESDATVNKKTLLALDTGLRVFLCIGETSEQRHAGRAHAVLREQLLKSLNNVKTVQFDQIVLAYEPVWAIGTNQTATAEQAEEAQHFCREAIAKAWNAEVAENLVIQYGGSVRPENAEALLAKPDIDGLLVGGASLSLDSFQQNHPTLV